MHSHNHERPSANANHEVATQAESGLSSRDRIRTQVGDDLPLLEARSRLMREFLEAAKRAAATNATILLTGESGNGKTLFARQIHRWSGRDERSWVALDCAALSEQSADSEGFARALSVLRNLSKDGDGRAEIEGVTLFLDNIGELGPTAQSAILQFVEEQKPHANDRHFGKQAYVRIIAASHRDLDAEVVAGRFRKDLFYRINVIALRIPTLRERPGDIDSLAVHLLTQAAIASGRPGLRYSREAASAIAHHSWPGNVRELRNVAERAAVLAPADVIRLENLPEAVSATASCRPSSRSRQTTSLEEVERLHIMRILEASSTIEEAATLLGINASTLWRKRKLHNLG